MRKYDMHIHARNTPVDSPKLIEQMEKAGIYGGCIFSNRPDRADKKLGTTFDERLDEVLAWTDGYEGRLIPVMWIHPYEDDIIKNIHKAVDKGIAAFKITCTDFYVYEEQCMKVLTEIAECSKPVFFHSGILWNGGVSSKYNRPLNWEALLNIKNLKFSMGHCSWPWHDECIALYGKFLNAYYYGVDGAEMFFDITPGTPLVYREELLRKIYLCGYDVPDNVMFGSDASADCYNSDWVSSWLKTDDEILERLGANDSIKNRMYHDNLMRFLGWKEKDFQHICPAIDSLRAWHPGCEREK